MSDTSGDEKSLEMRVAALEDKLKGLQVSEDEMRAYNKVASLMGMGSQQPATTAGATTALTPVPDSCVVSQCTVRACTISQCTVVSQCTVRACTIIQDCINECGGGCAPGGGGFMGGGGFGTLGG